MNRKILIIIIIILAITGIILTITQITSTLSENETNFAIADTASVTKIFMADMDGNSVLLEKQQTGHWMVNQKHIAQKDMVLQFLRTLMYVTVRGPVAIAARDNVIRHMASHAVKVEIFQKKYLIDFWGIRMFQREKLTKTFYVGDNTQEKSGTYMKMEKSENPYIVYIPGFKGFLHTRFSTNEHEWRDHTVFNLFMKDIDKVSMLYPSEPEKSFIIENPDNRNFKLFSIEEGAYVSNYDTINLINYLSGFYDARFEEMVVDPAKAIRDSLIQLEPFQILTVTPKTGEDISLITYLKPNQLTQEEMEARYFEISDYPWDRERMWAFINDETELVTIQYFVFGRILKPIQAFFPNQKENIFEGIHIIEME
jgi:hypothetical protein